MNDDNHETPATTPLPPPVPRPASTLDGEPTIDTRFGPNVHRLLNDDGAAVAWVGADGTIRDLTQPMLDLIGASSIDDVTAGSPADGVLRSFLDHLPSELSRGGNHVWRGRIDHRDATGHGLVFRATASPLADTPGDEPGDIALVMHDMTSQNDQLQDLTRRATHDPLTGLVNRHQLLAQLSQAIAAQRSRPGHVAAIFIDLDNLQYVNEAFGNAAGDRLLVSSARRLEQALRPVDRVARIGSDEFFVVASGVGDSDSALELAERARRALTGQLRVGELDLEFSVSVGVALSDAELLDLDNDDAAAMLISNADSAMNQSKHSGRDRCTLFTAAMRSKARERTTMARALAQALTDGDITVDYQPIRSAVSGAAVAAEALVRWTHPTSGVVDALTVVEVAEESGTIGRLGELVLGHALADLARWRASGIVDASFAVHVNVSRVQLGSTAFVNVVADRLARHDLDPSQLVLEARESPLLGRESEVIRSIKALRRLGVQIAVDNFGTGSKALAVLTDVGADVLKLDGALALPSGSSDADLRLVRAVVLLAHALDIAVVAQHIDDDAQLHQLRAAGCDMLQGNLLGPPTAADRTDFSSSLLV